MGGGGKNVRMLRERKRERERSGRRERGEPGNDTKRRETRRILILILTLWILVLSSFFLSHSLSLSLSLAQIKPKPLRLWDLRHFFHSFLSRFSLSLSTSLSIYSIGRWMQSHIQDVYLLTVQYLVSCIYIPFRRLPRALFPSSLMMPIFCSLSAYKFPPFSVSCPSL